MLFGLTLPPYKILILEATLDPYNDLIILLIYLQISSAISLLAFFPVPIAQIGSYAITTLLASSLLTSLKPVIICSLTNYFVLLAS